MFQLTIAPTTGKWLFPTSVSYFLITSKVERLIYLEIIEYSNKSTMPSTPIAISTFNQAYYCRSFTMFPCCCLCRPSPIMDACTWLMTSNLDHHLLAEWHTGDCPVFTLKACLEKALPTNRLIQDVKNFSRTGVCTLWPTRSTEDVQAVVQLSNQQSSVTQYSELPPQGLSHQIFH